MNLSNMVFSAMFVKNREWDNFWYWVYTKTHRDKQVVQTNGYKLNIDPLDGCYLTKVLLHWGGWEFYSSAHLKSILTEDDVVIDIGANIGYYAFMEAMKCKKVFAIEPVSSNYKQLIDNIVLNDFHNIMPVQCAVGDKDGEEIIYIHSDGALCSFVRPDGAADKKSVPIHTLDTLVGTLSKQPTLIRMDVEGYEYNIIRGARKTLGIPGLKLFIEFHPHQLMSREHMVETIAALQASGFIIRKLYFDPEPCNFKDVTTFNWLGKRFGFGGYGEHEPTYVELMKMWEAGGQQEAFLEKVVE